MRILFLLCVFTLSVLQSFAQFPPRREDHFWRKKTVTKVDLREKLNYPLLNTPGESGIFVKDRPEDRGGFKYKYNHGFIDAIMTCYQNSSLQGYDPNDLSRAMPKDEFLRTVPNAFSASPKTGKSAGSTSSEDEGEATDEGDGEEAEEGGEEEMSEESGSDGDVKPASNTGWQRYNLEVAFELIEDRIFDKNKSDMYYDIQYVRLICVDEEGVLPETPAIAFKYKDLMQCLDETQWRNRFNDAEHRSLREVFELRMFNGFLNNISDLLPQTLEESEKRKSQMIEYEHNLWHY